MPSVAEPIPPSLIQSPPNLYQNTQLRYNTKRTRGGHAAEKILLRQANLRIGMSCKDYHEAVNLASYTVPDPDVSGPYVDYLCAAAKSILRHWLNWAAVKAIAAKLLTKKTLTYREAKQLAKQAYEDALQNRRATRRKKEAKGDDPPSS